MKPGCTMPNSGPITPMLQPELRQPPLDMKDPCSKKKPLNVAEYRQVADSLGIQSRMQGWGGAMRACVGVRTAALPGRQHVSWAPCLGSQSIRGSWKATSPPSNQVCMSRLQAQRPGCACTKQVAAPPPALSGLMLPMGSCQLNTVAPIHPDTGMRGHSQTPTYLQAQVLHSDRVPPGKMRRQDAMAPCLSLQQ